MIRITRHPEPAELIDARRWRLARALIAWETRDEVPAVFAGYDAGRKQIWDQQHHKCAYCEAPYLRRSAPIEHYRPKAIYWWLAWSWDNLLQICGTCNTVKRDHFDLYDPTARLGAGLLPPGAERPKLIDPSRTDPRLHIRFVRKTAPDDPDEHRWEPEGITETGRDTIKALSLHDDLLDNYQIFADHLTRPDGHLAAIRAAAERGEDPRAAWWQLVHDVLADHQPYRSLAHDILSAFRDALRADHDVALPAIPAITDDRPAPPPAPLFPPDPTLDGWPEATRLHIRLVRSGNATADERRDALLAILTHRPLTRAALATLCGKTPATIADWLRPLIRDLIIEQGEEATPLYRPSYWASL